MDLKSLKNIECSCQQCKDMCKLPCWPTPEEADRLIENGYADKMMLDYWVRQGGDILLICPAEKGSEKGDASYLRNNGCVMQDEKGLCKLHDNGLKPIEGRVTSSHSPMDDLHEAVAFSWDNDFGKSIIEKWKNIVQYE